MEPCLSLSVAVDVPSVEGQSEYDVFTSSGLLHPGALISFFPGTAPALIPGIPPHIVLVGSFLSSQRFLAETFTSRRPQHAFWFKTILEDFSSRST